MSPTFQTSPVCPICAGTEVNLFVKMLQVPVHCNLLWPSRSAALSAPRGDIQLGYCATCGHIYNFAFDPSLVHYTQEYENSLHFSPRFQQYATSIATRLIDRYDLHGKTIIDIGAGKGDFLFLICELGGNRGIGFDPSYVPGPEEKFGARVTFIQDFYTEQYADYKADLVCSRHVLEHIQDPDGFVSIVRRAIGDRAGTTVFFEVPNVMYTLREFGIWDIIYEHCSYFSENSLTWLFRQHHFQVLDVAEVFGGQFLTIEAKTEDGLALADDQQPEKLNQLTRWVTAFAGNYRQKVDYWRQTLDQIAASKQRLVVWGGGSKGVSFLNTLQAGHNIEYVVDINPRKQGMYVAGSGQQIASPEFLSSYQPNVVVIMNPNYKDEIEQQLADLNLAAEIIVA